MLLNSEKNNPEFILGFKRGKMGAPSLSDNYLYLKGYEAGSKDYFKREIDPDLEEFESLNSHKKMLTANISDFGIIIKIIAKNIL